MDKTVPSGAAMLLAFIGGIEAPHGFDTVYGNNQARLPKPLTSMTIDEVIAAGPRWTKSFGSSAAGFLQFMRATLMRLEPVLGAGAFVYRHPGYMWRTAKLLFERGALPQPDEPAFRSMLDDTYAAGTDDLPECLHAEANKVSGEDHGKGSLGSFNVIKPEEGYGALSGELGNDEDIGTRLGEKQATARLARRKDGRLVPWGEHAGADMPLLWALSEVTFNQVWLGKDTPVVESAEICAVKASWPKFEQNILLAEVGDDGSLLTIGEGLAYDLNIGLTRCASAPHTRG